MTIKAIETRYAGCRFRSRLEARWAVFFDKFGITWQYEPEGFEIKPSTPAGKVWSGRYLPDFHLRGRWQGWAEVKGDPQIEDVRKAAAATIPLGGLPGTGHLDLLGEFGTPDAYPAMVLLFWVDGELFWARPWELVGTGRVLVDHNGKFNVGEAVRVAECWRTPGPEQHQFAASIQAARSARFEHGEAS